MLMFHANIVLTDLQQSSPRGGDKFFSTNWFMGMAQRQMGRGTFTVRAMLSLEPATVTERRYPLLFQQGETAFGVPIADGQHPHDFFMEVAALYDWNWVKSRCCRFISLRWETQPLDRQHTGIVLRPPRIPLAPWGTTRRIPRTSQTTS